MRVGEHPVLPGFRVGTSEDQGNTTTVAGGVFSHALEPLLDAAPVGWVEPHAAFPRLYEAVIGLCVGGGGVGPGGVFFGGARVGIESAEGLEDVWGCEPGVAVVMSGGETHACGVLLDVGFSGVSHCWYDTLVYAA